MISLINLKKLTRFDFPAPFAPMRTLSGRSSIFASRIDFHPASRRLVNCATSRPLSVGLSDIEGLERLLRLFLPLTPFFRLINPATQDACQAGASRARPLPWFK